MENVLVYLEPNWAFPDASVGRSGRRLGGGGRGRWGKGTISNKVLLLSKFSLTDPTELAAVIAVGTK